MKTDMLKTIISIDNVFLILLKDNFLKMKPAAVNINETDTEYNRVQKIL